MASLAAHVTFYSVKCKLSSYAALIRIFSFFQIFLAVVTGMHYYHDVWSFVMLEKQRGGMGKVG
jgi:hypothetical protein